MNSISFLKVIRERSSFSFTMQAMVVKTASNGSYLMNRHQRNAFGLQSQGYDLLVDCVKAHVNCLSFTTAVVYQKKMSTK